MVRERIVNGFRGLGYQLLSFLTVYSAYESVNQLKQGRVERQEYEHVDGLLSDIITGEMPVESLPEIITDLETLDTYAEKEDDLEEYITHTNLLARMYDGREEEDIIVRQELLQMQDEIRIIGRKNLYFDNGFGYGGLVFFGVFTAVLFATAANKYFQAIFNKKLSLSDKTSQEETYDISDAGS